MTPEPTRRKPGIAELGPAWITAIATLIGALIATVSFFAIRATTSPASEANSATIGRPGASGASTTPNGQSTAPPEPPGMMLTEFNVDIPGGYGLTLNTGATRPVPVDSGEELLLTWSNGFYQPDRRGTLATLDADTPTYAACTATTRFTSSIIFPKPGTAFCYLGHQLVVGIKVVKSLFGQYDTLSITVWRAP